MYQVTTVRHLVSGVKTKTPTFSGKREIFDRSLKKVLNLAVHKLSQSVDWKTKIPQELKEALRKDFDAVIEEIIFILAEQSISEAFQFFEEQISVSDSGALQIAPEIEQLLEEKLNSAITEIISILSDEACQVFLDAILKLILYCLGKIRGKKGRKKSEKNNLFDGDDLDYPVSEDDLDNLVPERSSSTTSMSKPSSLQLPVPVPGKSSSSMTIKEAVLASLNKGNSPTIKEIVQTDTLGNLLNILRELLKQQQQQIQQQQQQIQQQQQQIQKQQQWLLLFETQKGFLHP